MRRLATGLTLLLVTVAPHGAALGQLWQDAGARGRTCRISAQLRHVLSDYRSGRPARAPGRGLRLEAGRMRPGALGPGAMIEASIKFRHSPDDGLLEMLEGLGVGFHRPAGRLLRGETIVPVRIPLDIVEDVAQLPEVVRIESHFSSPAPSFADASPMMTGAANVWDATDANGTPLTGLGVTIGMIDSPIDIFHPSFFRADGGSFDWIDMDSDGRLDPGVDAVDYNHDGKASDLEIVKMIKPAISTVYAPRTEEDLANLSGPFVPDLDWLWLDLNGSGVREKGKKAGCTDACPAFGEPMFIADDADHSGTIETGEKLVLLKTSKLMAIYVPLADDVYKRGVNLLDYDPGNMMESHATMTMGVLAGNDAARQRFHGVAPDADIILVDRYKAYDYMTQYDSPHLPAVAATQWLAEQGADVIMHEYGSPLFEFGDGSSDLETAIDESLTKLNALSCTAAHNYAAHPMHALATVQPGGSATFEFEPSSHVVEDEWYYTATTDLWATMRWLSTDYQLSVVLENPGGIKWELGVEPFEDWLRDVWFGYYGREISPRGTVMANFAFYVNPYWAVQPGTLDALKKGLYRLTVTNPGDKAVDVDLFMADTTGYFVTGKILTNNATKGTMSFPATADTAVTVGAYRANADDWGGVPVGGLCLYSGRGPRIDDVLGLDVVAPSDALAAWHDPGLSYPMLSYAAGTSGALPQVTGAVALLLQGSPDIPRETICERLRSSALFDRATGPLPNNDWGYGKLSVDHAVLGIPEVPEQAEPDPDTFGTDVAPDVRTELTSDAACETCEQPEPPADTGESASGGPGSGGCSSGAAPAGATWPALLLAMLLALRPLSVHKHTCARRCAAACAAVPYKEACRAADRPMEFP